MNFLIAATIVTHITLLFTSFCFEIFSSPHSSIPIPTLQIISTHTFTICGSVLSCSSREPVSLSQHTLEIYVCLSVRPSFGSCACLRPVNSIATNDGVWQAGCSSLEQTSDSLVIPPGVSKKKGQKQIWSSVSYSYTRLQLYAMSLYLPARALTSPECREKTLTT